MKYNIKIEKDKIRYNKKSIDFRDFLVLLDCYVNNKATGNTNFIIEVDDNLVYKKFVGRKNA